MIAPARRKFLDLRALSALEHLRFATRQRIEGSYSGRHTSRRLGGAGEFADFREYASGDDLRWLDWKVLARTGRSYLRLFQDETNLICTLAIDASRSMEFAGQSGRSKLEYVQFLSSSLAYMIGQLKIIELREKAKAKLGARFDIRKFHNAVLDQGPMPLTTLERVIDDWIAEQPKA